MSSATVSAAILAGGRARRMHGLDKSALDVDGVPILERQLAVLGQLTDDLLIVVREDQDRARFAGSGARVVTDLVPDIGPLGGLYTALVHAAAPGTIPVTIVVACDMPYLTLPFLRHLAARVAGVDVAVPRTTDGYHPLCAAYAHTVKPFVERQIARGALAVQALFDADAGTAEPRPRVAELGPDELAAFDPDGRLLSNVNTPHDYRQACSRALNR